MQVNPRLAYLIYQQIHRLANLKKINRVRKAYRHRFRFAIAMHKQLLRIAFPDESRAYDKQRRERHSYHRREYLRAASRNYIRSHSDRTLANCRAYQARKSGAIVSSDRESIARIYRRAGELRQWFDVVVDHIIPLIRGGTHSADNLQIIYRVENEMKGSRIGYVPKIIFC